jgi:hypothetical protein
MRGKTIKMKIAILAVCVGMVALAQADIARANIEADYGKRSQLSITDVGSDLVFVLAGAAVPKPSGVRIAHRVIVQGGTPYDPKSSRRYLEPRRDRTTRAAKKYTPKQVK